MPTTFNVILLGNHTSIDTSEGNNISENMTFAASNRAANLGVSRFVQMACVAAKICCRALQGLSK